MTLLMTASCESGNKEFGYDGETAVYFANAGYVRTVELGAVSYTHLDVYKRQ